MFIRLTTFQEEIVEEGDLLLDVGSVSTMLEDLHKPTDTKVLRILLWNGGIYYVRDENRDTADRILQALGQWEVT